MTAERLTISFDPLQRQAARHGRPQQDVVGADRQARRTRGTVQRMAREVRAASAAGSGPAPERLLCPDPDSPQPNRALVRLQVAAETRARPRRSNTAERGATARRLHHDPQIRRGLDARARQTSDRGHAAVPVHSRDPRKGKHHCRPGLQTLRARCRYDLCLRRSRPISQRMGNDSIFHKHAGPEMGAEAPRRVFGKVKGGFHRSGRG
jgi:hypothetical protein